MIKKRVRLADRYLGSSTIQGFLLILFVLVFLFSFLELMSQLNDVGKGNYQLLDAFIYTLFTVPKRATDLMPVSALLGSIVALGILADHNELTAMQAAGISVKRICTSIIGTAVILMFGALIVAEFLAPPLDQAARLRRSQARYGRSVMTTKSGFWVRQNTFFIRVGKTIATDKVADVEIYELNDAGDFKTFIYAKSAIIQKDQSWLLKDIDQKIIGNDNIEHRKLPEYRLNAFLTEDQMQILKLPPDSLSITDLYTYIQSLEERELNAKAYANAFWQKICTPITTAVMVLLSLTFIFGSTRLRSAGQRIAIGMLVGVMFILLNQILGHLGLLLDIPPILTTIVPVVLILFVAIRLLQRVF